jgi:hypothetical protein
MISKQVSRRSAVRTAMVLVALAGVVSGGIALADHGRGEGDRGRGMVLDGRYHHDHYYPQRGFAVGALPHGYRSVEWGRDRFFFYGGVWYRPYGPSFVVVAPPVGVVIPFLPDFYTTVWFGGVPYYYANDAYYVWNRDARGYVVTQPPGDPDQSPPDGGAGLPAAAPAGPGGDDFFMYPRNNQSAEDQARDRFECHQWAVNQTGFDPSEPGGGVSPAQINAKRSDYRRAITACLEGRQYSVK